MLTYFVCKCILQVGLFDRRGGLGIDVAEIIEDKKEKILALAARHGASNILEEGLPVLKRAIWRMPGQ